MRAIPPVALALLVACGPSEVDFTSVIDSPLPTSGIDAPLGPDAAVRRPADAGSGSLDPGPELGSVELTYYYVASENDYVDSGNDTVLYQATCDPLATVPTSFAQAVVIEGTGELRDGRVFNYTGACPCAFSPCFRFEDAQHPWGSGANGRPLVPFISIAVDRNVLTIGDRYYVLELDGVTMPGDASEGGGFVHDGCVTADDTGGHIIGMHIDFFSALRTYYLALDRQLQRNDVTLYEGGDRCRIELP